MGALDQAFPESVDEILNAVKETARGRWFLENYEKRLRSNDSARILDSIARLERHIQSLSSSGQDGELLQGARETIAAARQDIAALEQKPSELSVEGQLFVKLAVLAKQSFTGPPAVSKGVARALRLVSDLEQQLGPNPQTAQAADFFNPDAAIFEPAPAFKNLKDDIVPRRTRLVIQHKAAELLASQSKAEEPAALEAEISPPPESTEFHHSRIVIIRRKASDMENLPLLETDSAANQETPEAATLAG